MTIKRKNITVFGLVEAEADPTDSVDVGGFSDIISSGAETAKYSGGGTIQAPVGLRVGTTQIKIVSGPDLLPQQTLISSDWSNGSNIVDGNVNTRSDNLGSVLPTIMEVIVDFGSIASRNIGTKFRISTTGNLASPLFVRFTTRIFISDTLTFGAETANQVDSLTGNSSGIQNSDRTFDIGPVSFRYVKFTMEQETTEVPVNHRIGDCAVYEVNLPLAPSTDAIVNIRASDSLDTANGTVIRGPINVPPDSTIVIDDDLLLIESQKYLTLDYATQGANIININLSAITSITEV